MWLKLIDIKAETGSSVLTSEENDIRYAINDLEFDVPLPIYHYLAEIGNILEDSKVSAELEIPSFPTAVAGTFGGYHSSIITEDNHNLFEEIPCLGVAADMVMAVASNVQDPIPDFRVKTPAGAKFTRNLCGNIGPISLAKDVSVRLNSVKITANSFPETVRHTRLNLEYMKMISKLGNSFHPNKAFTLSFNNTTMIRGGTALAIMTKPVTDECAEALWTEREVQPFSTVRETCEEVERAIVFGFQLEKENGSGVNPT